MLGFSELFIVVPINASLHTHTSCEVQWCEHMEEILYGIMAPTHLIPWLSFIMHMRLSLLFIEIVV